MRLLNTAKWGSIALAGLAAILGMVILMNPTLSVTALCYCAGALMMAEGLVRLIGYFSQDRYRLAFQFDLAVGVTSVLLGFIVVLHPLSAVAILMLAAGILMLTDGLLRVQTALDARRFGLGSWWLLLIVAVLSSFLGALLILNPVEGAAAMAAVFGLAVLIQGVESLCFLFLAIRQQKS